MTGQRGLGYLLIATSFLVGAYLSVRDTDTVPTLWFLAVLALGAFGVALVRAAIHAATRNVDTVTINLGTLESSLKAVVAELEKLDRERDSIGVFGLRHHIDREFPQHLDAFVQARESLIHRFGLTQYAEVMGHFAAGERYLNRVWSTSTDGYIDEAHTYIGRSKEQMAEALGVLQRLSDPG